MKRMDLKSMKQNPAQLKKLESEIDPQTMKAAQDAVAQYQGKNETELMEELARIAAQERVKGNLSDERMENIMQMLSPMLNPRQQQALGEIANQLKSV